MEQTRQPFTALHESDKDPGMLVAEGAAEPVIAWLSNAAMLAWPEMLVVLGEGGKYVATEC